MSLSGMTVGGIYRISEKIGGGAFGEVYRSYDTHTLDEVALKTELLTSQCHQLKYEAGVYNALDTGPGVPIIHWFGVTERHTVLVMELLGKSLEELVAVTGFKLSVHTVLMLVDQMISAVQFVHEKGFIHQDLKPDNFLMGANERSNLVYLVDYGLSKRYCDGRGGHIAFAEGLGMTGTAAYASVNSLKGYETSRRDDMESLGYILIRLARGRMPWTGGRGSGVRQRCRAIMEAKESIDLNVMCQGLPPAFAQYFQRVRELDFSERPDYEGYRQLFRDALIDEGGVYDYKYDWIDMFPTFRVLKGECPRRSVAPVLPQEAGLSAFVDPALRRTTPRMVKKQPAVAKSRGTGMNRAPNVSGKHMAAPLSRSKALSKVDGSTRRLDDGTRSRTRDVKPLTSPRRPTGP